jgi:hypothetical protein
MKTLDHAYVRAANDAYADIALPPARPQELTIELTQLRDAIEAVAQKVSFDTEPSDFRAAMLALAEKEQP